jgi:hypothetical protein
LTQLESNWNWRQVLESSGVIFTGAEGCRYKFDIGSHTLGVRSDTLTHAEMGIAMFINLRQLGVSLLFAMRLMNGFVEGLKDDYTRSI